VMFADVAKIVVKAGDGGNGAVSFRREKYVPAGGPDGGDGGNGGSIVFEATNRMRTLLDFRYKRHYRAENGAKGEGNNRKGKQGADLVIQVPPGTVIKDAESGKVMADLMREGDRVVLLPGGKGGKGNSRFATPTRQAPNFAQNGIAAPERTVILELKTIADVGLVGFPNAGKSTLLAAATRARPKIADYPFTTLEPNLGVVEAGGGFIIADIPGLIEGAHEGAGLGHAFLRHVERTRMLAHVVDMAGTDGRDPVADYEAINRELAAYSPRLAELPQVVVANKMDDPASDGNLERLEAAVAGKHPIFAISAAAQEGVRELMIALGRMVSQLPPPQPEEAELWAEEIDPNGLTIEQVDGAYEVTGPLMDRLTRSINFDDDTSLRYFQTLLIRKGVIDALRQAGCGEGDTVRIGALEFDFID
jgi:GTP-binding protein